MITIDLNPLSRTAQTADITIVDNLIRAAPNILASVKEMKTLDKTELKLICDRFDNKKNLSETMLYIRERLRQLSRDN